MTGVLDPAVDPGVVRKAPAAMPRFNPAAWVHHLPFVVLLIVGTIPRLVAMIGYKPILMFYGDSYSYLISAQTLRPPASRPFGYSAFLRLMAWTGDIDMVTLVQHVTVLVIAVIIYVMLVKHHAPVWVACLVTAPLLLDGYQVLIEHTALTETLFMCFILGCLLLVMRERVGIGAAVLAGLCLATAVVTRSVALPLVVLVVPYLVFRKVGWTKVVAFCAAFSIPLLAYAGWFASEWGPFAVQQDGRFLYARVASFADCSKMTLTPETRKLCEPTIPSTRPGPNFYAWDGRSPVNTVAFETTKERDDAARGFAVEAIKAQPLAYAGVITHDLVHYFSPGRTTGRLDTPQGWWNFPEKPDDSTQHLALSSSGFNNDKADVVLKPGAASFLRGWQSKFSTPGPLILCCLLLGVAGTAWGRSQRHGVSRWDPLLFAGAGFILLLMPSATSVFDYRYLLPPAAMLYIAGGLGVVTLMQRYRHRIPEWATDSSATRVARHRGRRDIRLISIAVAVVVVTIAVLAAPIKDRPIYARYVSLSAERGAYGYSLDSEHALAGQPDWRVRNFKGGAIYQSPEGLTYGVPNVIHDAYKKYGGINEIGLPASNVQPLRGSKGASVQWFTHGALVVSPLPLRTVLLVGDPFTLRWCRPSKFCDLGAPLGDAETAENGTRIQQFRNGVMAERPTGQVVRYTN